MVLTMFIVLHPRHILMAMLTLVLLSNGGGKRRVHVGGVVLLADEFLDFVEDHGD